MGRGERTSTRCPEGLPGIIILAGDGRCDSPGFSAKYCNYSVMNLSDNRIVDFELAQVTQSGSSQGMEKCVCF